MLSHRMACLLAAPKRNVSQNGWSNACVKIWQVIHSSKQHGVRESVHRSSAWARAGIPLCVSSLSCQGADNPLRCQIVSKPSSARHFPGIVGHISNDMHGQHQPGLALVISGSVTGPVCHQHCCSVMNCAILECKYCRGGSCL